MDALAPPQIPAYREARGRFKATVYGGWGVEPPHVNGGGAFFFVLNRLGLAWMASAAEYPDAQSHMQSQRPPDSYLNEDIAFPKRKLWRQWCWEKHPEIYEQLSELERPQGVDPDVEPEAIP